MDPIESANQKIVLLYLLDALPGLTEPQLVRLALDSQYMDYFQFASRLEALCDDGLASRSVRKGEAVLDAFGQPVRRVDSTPRGQEVLEALRQSIPVPMRAYLAGAVEAARGDLRREDSVLADWAPGPDGFPMVHIRLREGARDLLDLRLLVPDAGAAERVCTTWKSRTQDLFPALLRLFLPFDNPPPDEGPPAE